jgi:hypothetical protein
LAAPLWTLAATIALLPAIAVSQDADTREILAYVLTDAGLAKYTAASKKLAALESANPGACDEDSEASSINEMVAQLNAVPAAKAAIQSSGLTTREYVVFSWSLLQNGLAAWAVSSGGTLPAGASKANVDFYRRHEAEIQQLQGLQSAGCDDDQAEEETDEA